MLPFREKIGRMERTVMGALLSAAILGITSYYLGIFGISLKYHHVILPLALIVVGIGLLLWKEKKEKLD